MAARIHRRHSDEIRAKIQSSLLITFLHQHVIGEREMSASQVRAAEALLDRCVPKLSQIQHAGHDGGPVEMVLAQADARL